MCVVIVSVMAVVDFISRCSSMVVLGLEFGFEL